MSTDLSPTMNSESSSCTRRSWLRQSPRGGAAWSVIRLHGCSATVGTLDSKGSAKLDRHSDVKPRLIWQEPCSWRIGSRPDFLSGGSGIRTHGGLRLTAFQELRICPLCHPSKGRPRRHHAMWRRWRYPTEAF